MCHRVRCELTRRDSYLPAAGLLQGLGLKCGGTMALICSRAPFQESGVFSWCQPQLSFSPFWALLATSEGVLILSQKPDSFGRSCMFPSGPIWQLWPLAWPYRHLLFPFTGLEVLLPEKPTSFTRLFLMVSLFLALSVMPIPCTLDEKKQGQRTWINGVFLFFNISKQHKSVQWVQTFNYFHACCSLYPALNPTENASCYLQLMKNVALFSEFEHTPKHWPERSI